MDVDVLISFHINYNQDSVKNGWKIYIPESENIHEQNSRLAARLIEHASKIYGKKIVGPIITDNRIINNSNCTAVMLEMGYISNSNDVSFLSNDSKMKSVAESIIKSVKTFKNESFD